MIVIILSKCPARLRGDLTLWLYELSLGVYVGDVSSRVRNELWDRILKHIDDGQALLLYSTDTAQGFDLKSHNYPWEISEHEGLKFLLKPNTTRLQEQNFTNNHASGYSKASKQRKAQRYRRYRKEFLDSYIILDIETTGLNAQHDDILEIAAIKIKNSSITDTYHSYVKINQEIPTNIKQLTGIKQESLLKYGQNLDEVLTDLDRFISKNVIVGHNLKFDLDFIMNSRTRVGLPYKNYFFIDTLKLAKKYLPTQSSYELSHLIHEEMLQANRSSFGRLHRALPDCYLTMCLYNKIQEHVLDDPTKE